MNKLWAIGDIHGESKLLESLLKRIGKDDKIIFMGDMIDRGPDSKGVVEIVRHYVSNKEAIALLGNHETFALKPTGVWLLPNNGGQDTLESFGGRVPGDVLDWFRQLPVEVTIGNTYFCHAPYSRGTIEDKVWYYIDYGAEPRARSPLKFGVCGHIHRLDIDLISPRIYRDYAFIDTGAGCAPWAPLTAFEVYTRQILQEFS